MHHRRVFAGITDEAGAVKAQQAFAGADPEKSVERLRERLHGLAGQSVLRLPGIRCVVPVARARGGILGVDRHAGRDEDCRETDMKVGDGEKERAHRG